MPSLTKTLHLAQSHPARIHPGILSRFEKRIDHCPALLTLPSRLWVLLYFLIDEGTPEMTSARAIGDNFIAAILAARSQRSWGASSVEQRRRLANFARRHLSRLDDEGAQLLMLTLLRARRMGLDPDQVLFETWWRPQYRPHRSTLAVTFTRSPRVPAPRKSDERLVVIDGRLRQVATRRVRFT